MPLPSGELSNMRGDLVNAPNEVRMGVIANIAMNLQNSEDPADRSVGNRVRALLDEDKRYDASQLVIRYLRGDDVGGRRKTRRGRKVRRTRKSRR